MLLNSPLLLHLAMPPDSFLDQYKLYSQVLQGTSLLLGPTGLTLLVVEKFLRGYHFHGCPNQCGERALLEKDVRHNLCSVRSCFQLEVPVDLANSLLTGFPL